MEFNKAYNREEFLQFLRVNFLPEDFIEQNDTVNLRTQTKYTQSAVKLGVCKSLDLVVYEIKHSGKEDPRVGLSKEAFRLLADEWQSRALVLFVPQDNNANYRFSLININLKEGSKGKTVHEYSNPRRYSYYLGEGIGGYTPNKYLFEKGQVLSAKELQERFSTEVLTKEFYQELQNWYAWAVSEVKFPNLPVNYTKEEQIEHNSKNVIRLLTRLLFVWFLKQKHLIPNEFFDPKYLGYKILKDFDPFLGVGLFANKGTDSIYYKAILQNLFFATLNCPITPQSKEDTRERGFRKNNSYGQHRDVNYLMRYENLFKDSAYFLELVNKQVPFLNGGLFDCLDNKSVIPAIYIDGFTDNKEAQKLLLVPDFLFFGEEKGRNIDLTWFYGKDSKHKSVNVRGLIHILETYNFTIEENMPFDQEVSLDPELLGKVFENLLASYNPETKTTARKQTGSFYTPREIVQYMVDESLVAHFKRTISEELEEEYRKLMRYTDEEIILTAEQKKNIISSLYECKILDPACGSGAFPMGVLQQMVHILSQLDQNNIKWKELIKNSAMKEVDKALDIRDEDSRKKALKDIECSFNDDLNRPNYARKLYLIENCIYGVDIQPVAVQISKLRFFISLVVEQQATDNNKDNFGIRPLPNLEAKFVAANTLIALNKQVTISETDEVLCEQEKLKHIRHKIFSVRSPDRKRELREDDAKIRHNISELLKNIGFMDSNSADKMANWDPYDQNNHAQFFDPEWMFGVKNGFDIVIANPPYGYIFKKANYLNELTTRYSVAEYKLEAYSVFFECGMNLISRKGYLCYIVPYTFVSGVYFSKFRKYLYQKKLEKLILLGKKIFEVAEVDTAICLLSEDTNIEHVSFADLRFEASKDKLRRINFIDINKRLFYAKHNEVLFIAPEDEIKLYLKLNKSGKRLGSIVEFYHGIQTKGNDKALVNSKLENSLPIIKGSDFSRYNIAHIPNYIVYIKENIKSGGNLRYYHVDKKLIMRTTADRIVATIDYSKSLALNSVNVAVLIDANFVLEYILAIINSKLIDFWYKLTVQEKNKTFAEVKIVYIERIPIPCISLGMQDLFVKLANERIACSCKEEIIQIETKIDFIVYKLYNLTYDEVLIIDPNTTITKEQYEGRLWN